MVDKFDKKYCIFIFLLILSEIFFFRNILFNDCLFGDRGDGRLTMLITEHWYRFFQGLEKINDLGIFYPAENTLAYSDMLIGYGIIHSFFRFCGLDMFISYKITLILIHLLGVFTLFYFLNRILKLDYFWAFFGTSSFAFSCTYANLFNHTQLNVASFIPLFLIFLVKFIQNIDNRLKKNVYMYSAILIFILILYTAWYIFFFSALFLFVFIIVGLLFCYFKKIDIKNIIKKIGFDIIGYIIATVLLMIPFVLSEIPIMKMSGGRDYNYIVCFTGNIYSYIYSDYSIFDFFLKPLSKFLLSHEIRMGFSLILLFSFFIFGLLLFRKNDSESKDLLIVLFKILFISLFICLLLPIKLPFTNFSLWYFVYKYFIAGTSIRAVGRFLLFLSLPMSIITAILGNFFVNINKIEYKKYLFSMSILCLLLFVSNINVVGVHTKWVKIRENIFLNFVPSPPKDCKVFFVKSSSLNKYFINFVNKNLDAHEIAYKYNLKTINGYSGVCPKGYSCYDENDGVSLYPWILQNNLQNGIFSYDLINRKWEKVKIKEK